jgi:hypothetical protein
MSMVMAVQQGTHVSAIKTYCVGFDVDDHQIRGLMRFIKMTSRESKNEDDV